MNLEQFHRKYKNYSQKEKITIKCDVCGEPNTINKEKAEANIKKHGYYIDRSCAMKKNHASNPRDESTKQKQREGRLGKKHSNESKEKMSQSANEKWKTDWGIKQKKILAKRTAQSHCSNKFDKSKRKILYKSAKNGDKIRTCNSSYEYVFCEHFLEKDDSVVEYETQLHYTVEDRERSLDFLITYKNGSKKVVEIKPKKRLKEDYFIQQLHDSNNNATNNGWLFEVWTEDELGINSPKEATRLADEYRKEHYKVDYQAYRKKRAVERTQKHYEKHIKNDQIKVFCDFCQEEHTIMKLSHDKNVSKNGRFICIKENGHLIGSKPKPHLKKDNPYEHLGQKQCSKCTRILALDCFSKGKSICKECRAAHYAKKYNENKENKNG